MDELGLEAPDTMEEAVEIVRAFVEQDPGNNGEGNTIGLVCHSDLTGETGYRYEFQLNTLFASYSAFPKQWILQEDGTVVYGSVQPQVKEALAEVRKLYEEKLLDDSFMLRTMANIAELIVDGKCGSFLVGAEQSADGSDGEKPGCGMGALSDPDDRGWKAAVL